MKGVVTIIDVAKKAGVAPATVSHALNGKRPVNELTKKRIIKAINDLGYVPSWNASRMKSGRSGIIGCLAVDITETFTNEIIKGIELGLAGGEYSLLIVSAVEFNGDLNKAYNFLKAHNVDGAIFCYHISKGVGNLINNIDPFCPMVSINMQWKGMTSIVTDHFSGGAQAAEHLISCGVKEFAAICGPGDRISAINRFKGFEERLKNYSYDLNEQNVLFGEYSFDHGYDSTKKLFSKNKSIDGIFCENDYIAAGAISAAYDLGISVPDDIKILGYDDRDFSKFWRPPISTFSIPLGQMGLMGIYKLKDLINDKNKKEEIMTLQAKLIPRKSTLK